MEASSYTHTNPIKKWGSLLVMSLALAIIIIDSTLLNVSLKTIITELHTDIQSLQWVISAYSLVLAALTITGGRLGDLFGRKRMFVLGAIIFAIGSFTSSISNNATTLLIGEAIIEGIGAALMMPATASLLVSNFRGKDRAIAFGFWGGIAGAASAIGPILGGWLTTNYSWRWGFRINVFVAALLVIGSIIVKESKDREEKPSLDFVGVILSALGLLGIVFGFIESSQYGWWKAKEDFIFFGHRLAPFGYSVVPYSLLVGIIIVLSFIAWELYLDHMDRTPLVSLTLFENSQFLSGVVTTGILALGQAGIFFSIPIFLQGVLGLDALHTGLAILPMSLTALIAAPIMAWVSTIITPKRVIQIGLVAQTIGLILLEQSLQAGMSTVRLIPGLIAYGLGIAMVMAPISNLTLSAVSVEEAGEASGVTNTFRQIGSTLGSAIIGALLLTAITTNVQSSIKTSTAIPTAAKSAITQSLSSQSTNIEFGLGASQATNSPAGKIITGIVERSTTKANRDSLLYTSIFAILGFLVSFWLPNTTNVESEKSVAKHPVKK